MIYQSLHKLLIQCTSCGEITALNISAERTRTRVVVLLARFCCLLTLWSLRLQ